MKISWEGLIEKAQQKKQEWEKELQLSPPQSKHPCIKTVMPSNTISNSVSATYQAAVKFHRQSQHKLTNKYFNTLVSVSKLSPDNTDTDLLNTAFTNSSSELMSTSIDPYQTTSISPPISTIPVDSTYTINTIVCTNGTYEWDYKNNSLYYRQTTTSKKEIANFTICILQMVEERTDITTVGRRYYVIRINHPQLTIEKEIDENRYKTDLSRIGEMINPIFNIVNKGLFDRYLSDMVSTYLTQNRITTLKLSMHGWICNKENNIYRYAFNGTSVPVAGGIAHVINEVNRVSSPEMTKIFLDTYLRLSKSVRLLFSALLYTLHTHIALPYKEITGQRLQSAMVFQGETQYGKTVLASLLSQGIQKLCHNEYFYKYDGTNASINHILGAHGQGLYVFDDIYRKSHIEGSKSDAEKLNAISRILGDGTIPSKMKRFGSGLEESKAFDGGVIITAELLPIENESTLGRLIVNKFDATARLDFDNNQALTFLQTNPQILDSLLTSWLIFMEHNFMTAREELKNRHHKLYQVLHKQKLHTRLCSYGATMLNTLYYFTQFCNSIDIPISFTTAKESILSALETQYTEYKRHSDAKVFCEHIANAINCNQLPIANSKEQFTPDMAGFLDESGYYYIVISRLEEVLSRYNYRKNDCTAMYEKLYNQGLLYSTKRTQYRVTSGAQRPYLFRFSPNILGIDETTEQTPLTVDDSVFIMKGQL